MATLNGTIKRLVGDKGFGFIASGDSELPSSTRRPAARHPSTVFTRDKR